MQVAKECVGKKYINRGNSNIIFHHAFKWHQILKLYLVVQKLQYSYLFIHKLKETVKNIPWSHHHSCDIAVISYGFNGRISCPKINLLSWQ